MSFSARHLLALPLLAVTLPALAQPPCPDWRLVTTITYDTLVHENADGTCTWTTLKEQYYECTEGCAVRVISDSTSLTGTCDTAPRGPSDTDGGFADLEIDVTGIGPVVLDIAGADGTLFDVYDTLGNWITEGVIGEPVNVDAGSILTISAPTGSVDVVQAVAR